MILKSKNFQPRIPRIFTEKKPWPAWVFVSASLGERAFLDEIQRDLRDLSAINVDGIAALPRLLQVVALRVGSPLNMADLGRTLGLNQVTLKRYLTLFEALFLVKRLPPWFENMGKRLAKTPKLYFNDAGLLGYLLDLDPESLDSRPTQVGPLVENFVVMELTKLVAWSRVRPSLYHMRTSAGLEVDSVMENRKRELVGI